jgi:alkylation response protein AidB-like acyl-CoA dehydrogenase
VRLGDDPEVGRFRAEFGAFLDAHLPAQAAAAERSRSSAHVPDWARRWQRTLFDAGWLQPANPPQYGGRKSSRARYPRVGWHSGRGPSEITSRVRHDRY